jgi:hypothetical protein
MTGLPAFEDGDLRGLLVSEEDGSGTDQGDEHSDLLFTHGYIMTSSKPFLYINQ